MPTAKPLEGQVTLSPVERFQAALLWKIDSLREEFGMNRSNTIQYVLWRGLQHLGHTKGAVRAEYAEHLAERQSR